MSNSNKLFSSTVGKQAKHVATAVTAANAVRLLAAGSTAFPMAPVIAPMALVSLPVVLGVAVVAYGISSLMDGLFD